MGRLAGAYLHRLAQGTRLSTISIEPEIDVRNSHAFADCLLRDVAAGHVIVPFWSAHQLNIALLAAERFGLRPALARFEIVADDSAGGEIMWHVGERFGLTMRRIHTRGNPRRFEDVGAWLRSPRPFFIAVDGGQAYGTVPTGIVRMAARLGSAVWPVAVQSWPRLRLPGLVADVPLPGTWLALGLGARFQVDRAAPVSAVAEDLKGRLDAASEVARSLLAQRRLTSELQR